MKRTILTVMFLAIGALLFQGFQCSSPEFSTAKLAYQQNDFDKAKTNLEKELKKNPQNGQAWYYLANTELKLRNFLAAGEALKEARKYLKDENLKKTLPQTEAAIAYSASNEATSDIVEFEKTKDREILMPAIEKMKLASEIRPQSEEFRRMLAIAYELGGDTAKAVEEYKAYSDIMEPSLEFAKGKGFFKEMSREGVFSILGPGKVVSAKPYGDDSLYIDFFGEKGNFLFLYSRKEGDEGKPEVKGWRLNPPQTWSPQEYENWSSFNIGPYAALAQYYFDRQKYDEAAENVLKILYVEPSNQQANNFLVSVYEIQGNKGEALKQIEIMMNRFPGNINYIAQYGNILAGMEKYELAADQYKKALKLDPDHPMSLRNLAVSYKNIAREKQIEQDELAKKNLKPENPEEYRDLLNESAIYFEKSLRTKEYKNDIDVLGDLADIYYVTRAEEAFIQTVKKLEAMENDVPDNKKFKYYKILVKIYDRSDRKYENKAFFDTFPKKLESAQRKMSEYM